MSNKVKRLCRLYTKYNRIYESLRFRICDIDKHLNYYDNIEKMDFFLDLLEYNTKLNRLLKRIHQELIVYAIEITEMLCEELI